MKYISYNTFREKVHEWYNKTRPMSGKPKPSVISRWYDDYLNGRGFKFIK